MAPCSGNIFRHMLRMAGLCSSNGGSSLIDERSNYRYCMVFRYILIFRSQSVSQHPGCRLIVGTHRCPAPTLCYVSQDVPFFILILGLEVQIVPLLGAIDWHHEIFHLANALLFRLLTDVEVRFLPFSPSSWMAPIDGSLESTLTIAEC